MSPHRRRLRRRRKQLEKQQAKARAREAALTTAAASRKAAAQEDAPKPGADGGAVRPPRKWWQKRRAMFALSAPVWLVMAVSGGVLLERNATNEDGLEAYAEGAYDRAAWTFREGAEEALLERWIAYFNQGTAAIPYAAQYESSYWGAINAFDMALEHAGENRCVVQPNRAIAYELQGDHEMASHDQNLLWAEELRALEEAGEELPDEPEWGDLTVDELLDDALLSAQVSVSLYDYAAAARTDPECPAQSPEEEEEQEEALDRLSEKQSESESAAEALEEQQPEPEQSQSEQERQAELDERNQQAAAEVEAERQEEAAQENGGAVGGGGDEDGDEEAPSSGDGGEQGPDEGEGDAPGGGEGDGEGQGRRPKNW